MPLIRRAMVLQEWNGPCPLISIANVLLLRGLTKLPKDGDTKITLENLLNIVGTDSYINNDVKE